MKFIKKKIRDDENKLRICKNLEKRFMGQKKSSNPQIRVLWLLWVSVQKKDMQSEELAAHQFGVNVPAQAIK